MQAEDALDDAVAPENDMPRMNMTSIKPMISGFHLLSVALIVC
jgi:hypothetical protein